MFNWFSLDVVYYPVSAIMWVWYKAFAFILGPSNFFAWALSVMFLVFTLRAILYKPFVKQIRTTRQMQELQPQIKALQKKYGKDRQRMALEMQKLQREHGFNPILGCLPMLAQVPVFLGLYHVLMSFNRTQTGIGRLGLSVEENKSLPNYVFSATDVQHFLDANLFGAPLGATMVQQHGLEAFTEFNRLSVIIVGVPIMILAGIATHHHPGPPSFLRRVGAHPVAHVREHVFHERRRGERLGKGGRTTQPAEEPANTDSANTVETVTDSTPDPASDSDGKPDGSAPTNGPGGGSGTGGSGVGRTPRPGARPKKRKR